MRPPTLPSGFYITGGTLPRDAPSYIIRKADTDLFDGLLEGQFCYVLTSRQMGKSSLMVRTATRLRQQGVTCAVLDLTAIGQDLTREQWYDGLQNALGRQLKLEDELEAFWLSHGRMNPLQRWMLALEQIVLHHIEGNVVLFIDEIDAVRSLPFSADEFFAAIRELYNRRSESPLHARMTFCLLGVAAPSDLIRDTRTTPFNVGLRIDLTDFTFEEAEPLAAGLKEAERAKAADARPDAVPHSLTSTRLLNRVLHWTGGHPYLTQRLCHAVADLIRRSSDNTTDSGWTHAEIVDRACSELLVSAQARVQNDNLLFVRDRLLRSEADVSSLLELYRRVHAGRLVRDDEADPLITILRLSGITRSSGGRLYVRNSIYSRVFDQDWIASNMPDAEVRRHRAAFRRGVLRTSLLSGIIVLALAALGLTAMRQATDARHANLQSHRYAVQMDAERKQADAARLVAVQEARRVQQAENRLVGALRNAELRRKDAERQKQIAAARSAEAESARGETSEKLRDSYLAQAQASRRSGRVGQKYGSMEALERAARFPASPEFRMRLRNEAIATMSLPIDLRLLARHKIGPKDLFVATMDDHAKLFVTADARGVASVRRLSDGKEVLRLPDPGAPLAIARFSPGCRYLIAVYQRDTSLIRIWNLRDRSLSWQSSEKESVRGLTFTLDGHGFLICRSDKTVRKHELATGREIPIAETDEVALMCRFSTGAQLLAYIADARKIKVCSLATRSEIEIQSPSDVTSLAWSSNGALLAAAGHDNNVYVWNVAENRLVSKMVGQLSRPTRMDFLRDGRLLATTGWDGALRFWEVQSGRQILSMGVSGNYQFSVDEHRLCFAVRGVLQEFEVDAGQECRAFVHSKANGLSADFLRGSSLMMTAAQDGVRFWDLANGSEKASLPTSAINYVLFGADYRCLVHYNDADNRLSVRPLSFDSNTNVVRIASPSATRTIEGIEPVRCSLDGNRLICGRGSALSVFNLPGLNHEKLLQPHIRLTMAALSPDLRWAASGGFHGVDVKIWDTRSAACAAELPTGNRTNVAFSPDGKWLVTGNPFKYQFWRVGSWRLARETDRAPSSLLYGVIAFTKDGRQAALAYNLSLFHLVNPASGSIYAQLETPTESILAPSATFSPDGAYLACGTESGVFYVWDLRMIRARLARMGLDWSAPRPAPAGHPVRPLSVEIDTDVKSER